MTDIGQDRLGPAGDLFYAALLKAHHGLNDEQSARLNARLVLLLGNLVGDPALLQAAIDKAKERFDR